MNTLSLVVSLLASLFLVSLIIILLVMDWRSRVNRYLSFWSFCGLGIISTMFISYLLPDSPYLTEINKLTQGFTLLTFASVLALSFVFPKRRESISSIAMFLIILPALAMAVVIYLTDLSITKAYFVGGNIVREYGVLWGNVRFNDIYAGTALLYILLGFINFVWKYFKTDIYLYRLQIRYVFIGSSIAIIIAFIGSVVMPRFFNMAEFYAIGPSIAAIIITITIVYSVSTYNLMDVKTALYKLAMYSIMSALIFVPMARLVYAYQYNLILSVKIEPHIIAGLLVGIFMLYAVMVQPAIDMSFKLKIYEFKERIKKFTSDVDSLKDLDSVLQRAIDILYDSMKLKKTFFMMTNEKMRRYELFYHRPPEMSLSVEPIDRNASIIKWFVKNQEVLRLERLYVDDRSFEDFREDIIELFQRNDVQAMVPIYHDRKVFGIVCLGGKESGDAFNPDEMKLLEFFRLQVNEFISTALAYKRSMEEQYISRTVMLSSELQINTIPPALPNLSNIKFGAFYMPKYSDESNYFDFIRPGSHGVGVIATDISGVGINTALYSVVMRAAFQTSINEAPSTFTIMQKLNRVVCEYGRGNPGLVTAQYFYYDIKSMKLMYTNAGFPPLEVYRVEKNNFDSLDTEGIPLGNDPKSSYGIGRTNLLRGDIGVLYSKSLVNSKNQAGEEFGLSKLRRVVVDSRTRRPSEISERVKTAFESFLGISTPTSDVFVLVFKII